ncbi:MAG: heme A synthase [Acidimicrobiales bacterium]
MRLPRLSPAGYRRITLAAAVAVAFIIVTGAAVRLTGSGLGCPDWPTCAGHRLVGATSFHRAVESTNRSITGVVSVLVILAVLGSLRRQPRRRDLTWLSVGLVAGVVGQIVLGGVTVLFHLWPPLVMSHFTLSMAILADAVVLHHRAALPDQGAGDDAPPAPTALVVAPVLARMGALVVATAGLAVVLGTVVTGAGPHGGDEHVARLPFLVPDVARLHGTSVMILLALVVTTLWRLRRDGAPVALLRRGELLVAVLVAQAAVGYVQYFTGVPVVLVEVHVAGATAVWAASLHFLLGFRVPVAATPPAVPAAPGDRGAALLPSP